MESEEGATIPEKNADTWVKRLYVLRRKLHTTETQVKFLEDRETIEHPRNFVRTNRAVEIGKEVEENYLSKKDFEETRKTDPEYQRLVEEFASIAGNADDITLIESASVIDVLKNQAKELRLKADNIAGEHNTPAEKAQYSVFATRAYLLKSGPVWFKGPENEEELIPKGISQLKEELRELDKEKGTYKMSLAGVNLGTEEKTRLEALVTRQFVNVEAVSPTKPFLASQPRVEV